MCRSWPPGDPHTLLSLSSLYASLLWAPFQPELRGWLSGKPQPPPTSWDRVTVPSPPRVPGRCCLFQRGCRVDTEEAAECLPSHSLAGLPGGLRKHTSAQHQAETRLLLALPWTEKQVSRTRAGRGQGGGGENLPEAVDRDI